jgi:hypothetical protein
MPLASLAGLIALLVILFSCHRMFRPPLSPPAGGEIITYNIPFCRQPTYSSSASRWSSALLHQEQG